MIAIGRFHLIRVVLAILFVFIFISILYNQNSDVIRITTKSILSMSMSWNELEQLSKTKSCPICFGHDACDELKSDITKNVLAVSREAQNLPDLGQQVHGIHRNGQLRFWMKPQPSSPSLLQGFENYICAKSGNRIGQFTF